MVNVMTDEASPAPMARAIIEQFLARADEEIQRLDEIRKDGGLSTAGSSLRRFELRDTVQTLHQLLKGCPPAPVSGKQGGTPIRHEPDISGCREKIAATIAAALTEAGKDPILRDAITAVGIAAQTALLSLQAPPACPRERKRYLSLALAMGFIVIGSFAVSYGVDLVNQQFRELAKTKIACEASVNSSLEKEAEKTGVQQCAQEAQVQNENCAKAEQFKQACGNLGKIKIACNTDDDAQVACASAASADSPCASVTKKKSLCSRLAKVSDDCGKSWQFNAECENATKAKQLCRTTIKSQKLFEARTATSSSPLPEDKCASILLFGLAPESTGIIVILKSISLVFNILFVAGLIGLILSFLRLFGITLADSIIEALMNSIHDAGKSGGGKPDSSSALSSLFSLKGLVGTTMAATIGVAGVNTYQQSSISKESINKEYINKELRSNVDRSVEKYVKESVSPSGDEQKMVAGKLGEIADALKKVSEAQKGQFGPLPGGATHSVSIIFPKMQEKSDENAEGRLAEKISNALTSKLNIAMCMENHKIRCQLSDKQMQLLALCNEASRAEQQLRQDISQLNQNIVQTERVTPFNTKASIDCAKILKKIVECEEACAK